MTDITFIDDAVKKLFIKLRKIDVEALEISAYNKHYLLRYINHYNFYMALYKQLLIKDIAKLPKPVSESVFADYGGGCGILSFLASEVGFKMVIYNDVYKVSVIDAFKIAAAIKVHVDYYVIGDAKTFATEVNLKNLNPDLICSFDVLEHIYDWKVGIKDIMTLNNAFSLLFMTSANTDNPIIKHRLKKIHYQNDEEVNTLAKQTRGLMKAGIEQIVTEYIKTGAVSYKPDNTTNTCDPYTGSWSENLININELKTFGRNNHFNLNITNAYYSYSNNKLINVFKYFLNGLIKILGKNNLFFSPVYVLEINKK